MIPAKRADLWLYIYQHFGVKLPHKRFSTGHSTPLDFLHDALANPSQDIAAWASRSGGKTLCASILAACEFLDTDKLQSRVLAGSEDQARNLYDYWSHWCQGPLAHRLDDGNVRRHLTRVGGGRMEILAASQKKVRGPKVQRLFEDELDEIDEDVNRAAVGMIDSRPGLPGRTVYTSTWHWPSGPMGKLVDACPDNGVSLHRWNLWESIQQCPESRHGNGSGCALCPLGPECLGKAEDFHERKCSVGIAVEACGIYAIGDAIKAVQKVGLATWQSEYLCNRPSVEGLVYPEFDERTHGAKTAPSGLTIYRAIDWGHGVFVCLWIGQDKDGRSWVLDTYRSEASTIPQHAEFINAHAVQNVKATYCDPAGSSRSDQTGRSNVDLFRDRGIPCQYRTAPSATNVHNGIQLVRSLLQPASGPPKLLFVASDNNRTLVRAMQSYHNRKVNGVWIDDPSDPQEYEHIPDALRYFVVNRSSGGGMSVRGYGVA